MHAKTLICAAVGAAVALAAPSLALAQNVPAAPPAEKKPAATGVKSYEAGAKAFEAGKYGPAIQSLSNALSLGGLSSQQMAKALYYRGVAYRKTGKSAQAISDLTSAVWLKNGLGDADRAAAMDQRQGAYTEAGLGSATPIGAAPLDAPAAAPSPSSAAVATAAPQPGPAPAATVAPAAPAVADSATSSWSATSAKNAAEASVPDLSTPAGGYATLSSPDAPSLSAMPQGDASASPAAAPMAGVGDAISNAGSSVTGFFSNMFGGNAGSATAEPSAEVATAGVDTAAAPSSSNGTGAPVPPVPATGWQATTTGPGAPPAAASVAPAAMPEERKKVAAADRPRAKGAGKYRLQVSIVRSREEAESITAALRAQHAAEIGVATAAIDEVTFGNNTFYRVQVGPYASAAEPGQFCTALKPKGYDCLVVTK
ncbi:MAG: SPOR domain-containing protein [Hyphomicrobium sp.]|nr:SPOR domain-containing protein [Hyphomicrobium sp.]